MAAGRASEEGSQGDRRAHRRLEIRLPLEIRPEAQGQSGLVRTLNALIAGVAVQLGQIAEQGLVSGEPPSASEAPRPPESDGEAEAEAGEAPVPVERLESDTMEDITSSTHSLDEKGEVHES